MAEISLIASVVQVINTGIELSISLYSYAEKVSSASKSVKNIASEVKLTSTVLEKFRDLLEQERHHRTANEEFFGAADELIKACLEVFTDIQNLLQKHFSHITNRHAGRRELIQEKLKWPFLQKKIELLRSNLEKRKASLHLMVSIITFARLCISGAQDASVEQEKAEQLIIKQREVEDRFKQLEQDRRAHGLTFNRYGLTEVDAPEGSNVDIVFVHGLYGDPEKTWTSEETEVFWPGHLLPSVLEEQRARLLVYGYEADIATFTDVGTASKFDEHALHLVQQLAANRQIRKATERPLIFVAHSLGGLIVKSALNLSAKSNSNEWQHLRPIYISTYGVHFLGTPHILEKATWFEQLTRICHAVAPRDEFQRASKALEQLNYRMLQDIAELDFTWTRGKCRVCCFHECVESQLEDTLCLVVERDPATLPGDHVERAGIHADHAHICKFDSDASPGFDLVCGAIQRYARDAPSLIKLRWVEERDQVEKISEAISKAGNSRNTTVRCATSILPQSKRQRAIRARGARGGRSRTSRLEHSTTNRSYYDRDVREAARDYEEGTTSSPSVEKKHKRRRESADLEPENPNAGMQPQKQLLQEQLQQQQLQQLRQQQIAASQSYDSSFDHWEPTLDDVQTLPHTSRAEQPAQLITHATVQNERNPLYLSPLPTTYPCGGDLPPDDIPSANFPDHYPSSLMHNSPCLPSFQSSFQSGHAASMGPSLPSNNKSFEATSTISFGSENSFHRDWSPLDQGSHFAHETFSVSELTHAPSPPPSPVVHSTHDIPEQPALRKLRKRRPFYQQRSAQDPDAHAMQEDVGGLQAGPGITNPNYSFADLELLQQSLESPQHTLAPGGPPLATKEPWYIEPPRMSSWRPPAVYRYTMQLNSSTKERQNAQKTLAKLLSTWTTLDPSVYAKRFDADPGQDSGPPSQLSATLA